MGVPAMGDQPQRRRQWGVKSAAELMADPSRIEEEIKAYAARRRTRNKYASERGRLARRRAEQTYETRQHGIDLTGQQLLILDQLAQGATYLQIADRYGMSKGAISTQLTRIKNKLGVVTAQQAIAKARELGLIPADRTTSPVTRPQRTVGRVA